MAETGLSPERELEIRDASSAYPKGMLSDTLRELDATRAALDATEAALNTAALQRDEALAEHGRLTRELLAARAERDAGWDAAEKLRKTFADLVAKMDAVAIDTNLGDETDRVFAHWEFNEAREALAAYAAAKAGRVTT